MKKLLLAGLLIAFAGIGPAKTSEIINPPKPKKEYKLLLVAKYKETPISLAMTEYFYTDSFHVKLEGLAYYSLTLDSDSEWCIKYENVKSLDQFSCVDVVSGFSSILRIAHDPWDRLFAFFIAEVPNLVLFDKTRIGDISAQPAKVVFIPEAQKKTRK